MRRFNFCLLLLLSLASGPAHAAAEVTWKPAEMELSAFLSTVSRTLDTPINASAVADSLWMRVHPGASGKLDREKTVALLASVLAAQGLTAVYDPERKFYRIQRQRDARDGEIPWIRELSEVPDNDLLVTHAVQLKHASAEELARSLRAFAPANSRIVPDAATSRIFFTDRARAMKKYHELASILDTPQLAAGLAERKTRKAEPCPGVTPETTPATPLLIGLLLTLIGLLLGFIIRGYVIRRIEGGL